MKDVCHLREKKQKRVIFSELVKSQIYTEKVQSLPGKKGHTFRSSHKFT